MSEHLFRFLLSELQMVRVCCRKCRAITELPITELAAKFPEEKCRFCAAEFDLTANNLPILKGFQEAVAQLMTMQKAVEIEFTVPAKEAAKG